jgi:hypothetical protein
MVNARVEVNADCTGLLTYSILLKGLPAPAIGPYVDRLIVNPSRDEILGMGVQSPLSKPMWVYTLNRISHVPSPVSWPAAPDAK